MITKEVLKEVEDRYPDDMQLRELITSYTHLEYDVWMAKMSLVCLKGAFDEHSTSR